VRRRQEQFLGVTIIGLIALIFIAVHVLMRMLA
jgi:flagellar biogenesis protein FliO